MRCVKLVQDGVDIRAIQILTSSSKKDSCNFMRLHCTAIWIDYKAVGFTIAVMLDPGACTSFEECII